MLNVQLCCVKTEEEEDFIFEKLVVKEGILRKFMERQVQRQSPV